MASSTPIRYSRKGVEEKSRLVDDFFYDIDKVLSQFYDHWSRYVEDIQEPRIENGYRGFEAEENNLGFQVIADGDDKAVIKLEYRDEHFDSMEAVRRKLEKVWNRRIETVLERGER